jgi:hypothetical protein
MIKSIFKIVLVFFVLFSVGCTDKKNRETIDYILSQHRDSELLGWWKWNLEDDAAFYYWYFKESGTIGELQHTDGTASSYSECEYYWYTEKKDREILHRFYPHAWFEGKEYYHDYYKIKNDSLWRSSGIEGDRFFEELRLFAVKVSAPKGYEHVK